MAVVTDRDVLFSSLADAHPTATWAQLCAMADAPQDIPDGDPMMMLSKPDTAMIYRKAMQMVGRPPTSYEMEQDALGGTHYKVHCDSPAQKTSFSVYVPSEALIKGSPHEAHVEAVTAAAASDAAAHIPTMTPAIMGGQNYGMHQLPETTVSSMVDASHRAQLERTRMELELARSQIAALNSKLNTPTPAVPPPPIPDPTVTPKRRFTFEDKQ